MTRIPGTDLDIRPLVLGANTFGWTADEHDSHAILDAFLGAGGSLVDTADGYSHWADGNNGGESERIIGSWLEQGGRRDDIVIATKVATHPEFKGLAPENISAAVDASLARLRQVTLDESERRQQGTDLRKVPDGVKGFSHESGSSHVGTLCRPDHRPRVFGR